MAANSIKLMSLLRRPQNLLAFAGSVALALIVLNTVKNRFPNPISSAIDGGI